ncbi:MAG TPA: hypothetical protein VG298_04345, partial [Acidimicrobiales bacterium]|nr:hypothetical protein [Acidimicrobiales bacterium]
PARPAHRFPRLLKTQRALQVVLGLFWILDAALQFQPFMFGRSFVTNFILANASGQPTVVSWAITNVGHFLEPHIAVWNTFFALIQVVIGVGLLFRRSVRPALALSFVWALGVWVFGEGLGMLLTGAASPLTGAPGSVLIYGLIGVLAWPRAAGAADSNSGESPVGVASSAAGRGWGGSATALGLWSGYWVLAAILFILPDNRTQTSVSSAIVGMAPGTPGWYSHFLTSFGNFFNTSGTESAWVLAVISLVIGLGPLVRRRIGVFLFAGGVLSLLLWISGQGWLGGVFSGTGTDPNTGPLVILLAFAMVPAAEPDPATWRSPLSSLLRWNPVLTAVGAGGVVLAMVLGAVYPVAAQESSGTAMSGMVGMSGSNGGTGGSTASSASCTSANNGAPRTGLDVNNTPNMIMSGTLGMNMNGNDATAAAGLNTTKANWHYTGPALPAALAQQLLAQGGNGSEDLRMASSGCATEPTFSQEINSTQYVQSTSQSVSRYTNPFQALAAGYVAVSPTDYPVVYYVNPTIMAANAAAKRTLNPQHVDGLVFAKTPSGSEVLAAAMYVLPPTVTQPPMPFGALVQWHERTDVCVAQSAASTGSTTGGFDITGVTPCASGTLKGATPYLSMVWQIPVAGGPLAIQPPDIQIVEASIMQGANP